MIRKSATPTYYLSTTKCNRLICNADVNLYRDYLGLRSNTGEPDHLSTLGLDSFEHSPRNTPLHGTGPKPCKPKP